MVDDVKDITETAASKASAEALDRSRLARERREAEQRKRLDELRAHAAAAQAQREKRDDERRRRQNEQRARDDDRRHLVEERKRAIWEASISRREALLQREKERTDRMERARAARSTPRSAFAFGSSTPRLLEPLDSGGFFWAARRAASTTNVMYASAPLTRRASALNLDSENDGKDESDRSPQPLWSSVARRRTDLVPTVPAPRPPGRAQSMTRLDHVSPRLPSSPSLHHLNRTHQPRSGETTPGSRPGSALSCVRRAAPSRRPRPASIAGTGVNTPRGPLEGGMSVSVSAATTPGVSRDPSLLQRAARPRPHPRPVSIAVAPGEGKPPLHRKPKPAKEHDKTPRGKSVSPGRVISPHASKETLDKDLTVKKTGAATNLNAREVSQKLQALQITHNAPAHDKKTEIIQNNEEKPDIKPETKQSTEEITVRTENTVQNTVTVENKENVQNIANKDAIVHNNTTEETAVPNAVIKESVLVDTVKEIKENVQNTVNETVQSAVEETVQNVVQKDVVVPKIVEKEVKKEDKRVEKESSQERLEENEMTASMSARRITTEEQAKAALAERRRRAREELERQAELDRLRIQREAEEEAERQKQEEERQRREEEEARELAAMQRQMQEEKLRKAIEAQQQLEREEAERRAREEAERAARAAEEEVKRAAAERAELLRRAGAERAERERLARKQRVEAIMARTRANKQAEEDSKQKETNGVTPAPSPAAPLAPAGDNGNHRTDDLLGLNASQPEESKAEESNPAPAGPAPSEATNNGNDTQPLDSSQQHNSDENSQEQPTPPTKTVDNANTPTPEPNNGNVGHISANFIQTERMAEEIQKLEQTPKLIDDDFTTHNGHNNHPLTLQNAI